MRSAATAEPYWRLADEFKTSFDLRTVTKTATKAKFLPPSLIQKYDKRDTAKT